MKRITALLLAAVLLFSVGIITSCSSKDDKSEETTVIAKKEAVTEAVTEVEFDSQSALDRAIEYLVEVDENNSTKSDIENRISYKMFPSKDKSIFFMRYNFSDEANSDDLLIFKNGKVISLNEEKSKFEKYNDKFSVNIIGINDKQILKQPDGVSGGYGSDFDV